MPSTVTVAESVPDDTEPPPIEPVAVPAAVVAIFDVQPPNWPSAKSCAVESIDEPDDRVLSNTVEMHSSPKPSWVRSRPPSYSSLSSILLGGDFDDWSWNSHGEVISPVPPTVAASFTIAQPLSFEVALFSHLLSPVAGFTPKLTGWRSHAFVTQLVALPLPVTGSTPTHSKTLIVGLDVNALWTNRSPGVQGLPTGTSEQLPGVWEPVKPQPFGFGQLTTLVTGSVTEPAPATVTALWRNHRPMFVSPLLAKRVPPKKRSV